MEMRIYEKNKNDDIRIENRFNMLHNQSIDAYADRQNSFRTEANYKQGMDAFCHYLAENTSVCKLENGFKPRNIIGFVNNMKDKGLSASTQKTYMAAIRNYADRTGIDQRNIPNNKRLQLDRRTGQNVDRNWTDREFQDYKKLAEQYDEKNDNGGKMGLILDIGREFGCRIEGVLGLDIKAIENALDNGELKTKEKNGKININPVISDRQRDLLNKIKKYAEEKGNRKIFVDSNFKTTLNEVENFIKGERLNIQDTDRLKTIDARNNANKLGIVQKGNLTYHGLRHTYARDRYKECLEKGMSQEQALKYVSRILGHNRPEITKTYLAQAGMEI